MCMKQFQPLSKLKHGDQVAVISPSTALPHIFPWVQNLGLERMRDVFFLRPIEYPTTRTMGSSLQDRARDVMAAFADKQNKAVFASIGGSDQIQLIKYLDPRIFIDNPKPFFGYSDNTHLHNFLWNLGIPSYYGGGVMNQFGMNVAMYPETVKSLNQALFTAGEVEMTATTQFNEQGISWENQADLLQPRPLVNNPGWSWDGDQDATGIIWGGCVESMIVQASTGKYLPSSEDLTDTILILETAEDIPEHWIIEYLLTGFGERGWFDALQAVLIGRPKSWEFDKPLNTEQRSQYKQDQQATVVKTIRQYNQTIPIVQNVDFGHTDPQIIMPLGQQARIMSSTKQIFLTY